MLQHPVAITYFKRPPNPQIKPLCFARHFDHWISEKSALRNPP